MPNVNVFAKILHTGGTVELRRLWLENLSVGEAHEQATLAVVLNPCVLTAWTEEIDFSPDEEGALERAEQALIGG